MNHVASKSVKGLLALTALRGIGPATAERIAQRYVSLYELTNAEDRVLDRLLPPAVAKTVKTPGEIEKAYSRASRIEDEANRLGVRIVSVYDASYPALLRSIPDRPSLLYVKGNLSKIDRSVACIGTREPSEFGREAGRRIVLRLVEANWSIVSGLALGVDAISHEAALEANGTTIAVMGGGLDDVYPKKNALLAERILARGGALISEQPFGAPPTPPNLVKRDRLQSGLSVATFVMQTDIKGGSMHTVRYTLQQERLLYAPVPTGRHAQEPKSQGILALTQCPGAQLADMLRADGDYRELLLRRYAHRPVALPLASRDDYASMLQRLEERVLPHQGQPDTQPNLL